ncbi:two-component system NarL family sensor kinase [Roseibium hamelinense]|uniref:Oxygen sensor histidine kinase NreB n=1 Tax=Roseibium hamelinense TaxID=150831 RepID=A0A562SMX2_9HYPH|nr:cache domain-containing protein [Roseibium hamelinense]MTI45060.1 histidine kinase [Roseibium hamelinense]TWI82324.1 two-component system NarL family sensor kinase [Roseibium hamelinense]
MTFKTKLVLITILPLIAVSVLIGAATYFQARHLIEVETRAVEDRILATKKQEIQNYISLALTSISRIYENEPNGREAAQEQVKEILHNMTFGEDGYFFVYTREGVNLVHPKLGHLVGEKWWDLQDPEGDFVIQSLIEAAEAGGDFHEYVWHKPSTGLVENKLGFAIMLEKWGWMLGTGLYTDDIDREVEIIRADFAASIRQTVFVIFIIALAAIVVTGTLIAGVRFSEQRFADSKLKELTNRIFEIQEQERKRVSTELHDSISQLLVSVRYGIELIHSEAGKVPDLQTQATKCLGILDRAISEVRRISRDLRPSVLDDMGLATALVSLGNEFETHSGIKVTVSAERGNDRLPENAKTALYRVVQECMTNVARHSNATEVDINLSYNSSTLSLTIKDDGVGIQSPLPKAGGLGIRNMRERIETLGGTLRIMKRTKGGTRINVTIPLSTRGLKAA